MPLKTSMSLMRDSQGEWLIFDLFSSFLFLNSLEEGCFSLVVFTLLTLSLFVHIPTTVLILSSASVIINSTNIMYTHPPFLCPSVYSDFKILFYL